MQHPLLDEVRDRTAGRERRVQADPGVRPLHTFGELLVDEVPDALVAHLNEARCEQSVIRDDLLVDLEDVHFTPLPMTVFAE